MTDTDGPVESARFRRLLARAVARASVAAAIAATAVWLPLQVAALRQLFPVGAAGHGPLPPLAPWIAAAAAALAVLGRRRWTSWRAGLALAAAAGLALALLYPRFVERVPVGRGQSLAAFTISWQRQPGCACPPNQSDLECIAGLSLKPANVDACWGENRVWGVRSALSLAFVGLLAGVGLLTGAPFSPRPPPVTAPRPQAATAAEPGPGHELLHYRIVRRIGQGAMGAVYEAEDGRLGRRVALKVLPADLARDRSRLGRFRREAEAAARLNHPNIVTLHSLEQAAGIHFLTMELVSGATLDERLRPGGLPLDELLALAVQLADAVAAAHAEGVVHRDLKPGNVMVTGEGTVKVVDFGLARPLSGGPAPAAEALTTLTVTRTGAILGTPAYMSPEQVQGGRAGKRADIFALGVMLYEMATGQRPFEGDSIGALMVGILSRAPRPILELRPDLPTELDRVVARCLAKEPASRLGSAAELGRLLRALVAG